MGLVKVALVLALLMGACCWVLDHTPSKHQSPPPVLIDRSDAAQRQRANAIEKLVARGVVQKLDHGQVPVLWIGPAFAALPSDEKYAVAQVAYGYAGDPDAEILELRDGRSENEVGRFSLMAGLNLY
jgi:hypothetical protein